jgi:hypothetical protein
MIEREQKRRNPNDRVAAFCLADFPLFSAVAVHELV